LLDVLVTSMEESSEES